MNAEDFTNAFRKFVNLRYSAVFDGPTIMSLQDYDLCDQVADCQFRVSWIGMQVASDLRELINCQNRWVGELSKWQTWMSVLPDYDEEAKWDLRIEFVDGIARACMLEPSAMRDRVLRAFHFTLHHANLTVVQGYKDELPEDGNARKKLRSDKNAQRVKHRPRNDWTEKVSDLANPWDSSGAVLTAMEALDSEQYREASMDYRNASSHSIAPHFEVGVVPYVSRSIEFASKQAPREDGRVDFVEDRTRHVVRYGFGERCPLSFADAFSENLQQLAAMRRVMAAYQDFLLDMLKRVSDPREPTLAKDD